MSKQYYVRVIGDYGDLGDMAFAEVADRLDAQLHGIDGIDFKLRLTSVPAFDTVATGFVLAQLAINSPLKENHIFYVNTAPRKDKMHARQNNEGEGLVYAKLINGARIVAVNSGHSLTLIKPFAEKICQLNVANDGSQFRSRDVFPRALGAVARGDDSVIGDDIGKLVPDEFPRDVVAYTDGYGNLKCTVDPAALAGLKGQRVTVEINGREQVALVGAGIFDVVDGEYCFARGSSGWTLPNGRKVEFAEVVKRGGHAAKTFGSPPGGIPVRWRG